MQNYRGAERGREKLGWQAQFTAEFAKQPEQGDPGEYRGYLRLWKYSMKQG